MTNLKRSRRQPSDVERHSRLDLGRVDRPWRWGAGQIANTLGMSPKKVRQIISEHDKSINLKLH